VAFELSQFGRQAEALIAYDRATELDPTNSAAWCDKGNTLHSLSRYAEALGAYERATELGPKFAPAWSNKANTLNALGRYAEALTACERAIKLNPRNAFAIENRGRAKLGLGQIGEAMTDFNRAITIVGGCSSGAFEGLAEGHILLGNWSAAETALSQRLRLPPSHYNPPRSWHLPEVLTAVFRSSADRGVWADRIGRLADIAREAQDDWDRQIVANPATPVPTKPLARVADSLVRSLTSKVYAESLPGTLEAWAEVWRGAADRHPDLALAARLFGVGVRYVRTKDERVLLDLLQEERAILRDLFRLSD
jgi:tetratricopeptide (TPR) repeat protein